ncbi:helix-turn-helix domain-containing protein [Nocardia seriolae]|uniref:helix-turn-helix domain-containing protein n=1 Tax=Nocardia seriolae TaxID=37332 RepID=UPI0035C74ACA
MRCGEHRALIFSGENQMDMHYVNHVPTCAKAGIDAHETKCRVCWVKANTAHKFRLYPTQDQADRLTGWSDTCRAVSNTALAQRVWAYHSAQRVT